MTDNVALIATNCNGDVAIIASARRCGFRYTVKMLKMHEWVREAHRASGLSSSELSRRLYERLGRQSADRSIIGKMSKAPGSKGAKARGTKVEEILALVEITGFPLPESLRSQLQPNEAGGSPGSDPSVWLSRGDNTRDKYSPLRAEDLDEPIEGERAIRSVLGRIVGLVEDDIPQALYFIMQRIGRNTALQTPSEHRDQSQSANRRRASTP